MPMAPVAHEHPVNHEESFLKHSHRTEQQAQDASISQAVSLDGRRKTLELATSTMLKHVQSLDIGSCDWRETLPFLVGDIGEVYRQHLRWKVNLPRVKPHYAVKCNPEPALLQLLAELGTGFDCASMQEIESVLSHGVDPSRIIFAHPRKDVAQARRALASGVNIMTCDSEQDLLNAKKFFPAAKILIRIATDDSGSKCRLGYKFGACEPFDTAEDLLHCAKALDMDVVGVSFHIGSDASDPQAYTSAVQDSRAVFDYAQTLGFELSILDVGGGFTNPLFEQMAKALNTALDLHFPPSVRIIGEPGRFYVGSAFVLACQVTGLRKVKHPGANDPDYQIDINEGVYGTLANVVSDHQDRAPKVLLQQDRTSVDPTKYLVWGPTCDSFDKPTELCILPGRISYGDWLFVEDMGAYTLPCATEFNGNPRAKVKYVSSEPGAAALLRWQ